MTETIYLAGGCFWGTQHFLRKIKGVVSTEVGYANSTVSHPTYKQVCDGGTHAAETVKVDYDPSQIALADILSLYFLTIDPTSVNRQGGDRGEQYRTGIYYTDEEQKEIATRFIGSIRHRFSLPIAVEVLPIQNFYPAEQNHQDYLINNPGGYCHVDPRLFKIAEQFNRK